MSNYLLGRVPEDCVCAWFAFGDSPEKSSTEHSSEELPSELSLEEAKKLADLIAATVAIGRRALWFNPETDHRQARIDGKPIFINGRPICFISPIESAIFPM